VGNSSAATRRRSVVGRGYDLMSSERSELPR
jgi:hypothetical protein